MSEHDHHDGPTVSTAVLTVSSSRTLEEDPSGDAIVDLLESAGHEVVDRDLVPDDADAIREHAEEVIARADVDALVTSGGTGITPDDVTVDVLGAMFDRELPGFGEQFRARSVEEVGPRAMLSRATAGVVDGVVVCCLPGSENAARFGTSELLVPILPHAAGHAGGDHEHHLDERDERHEGES